MPIANLYNITVDVQRPAMTQDNYGASVKTWANIFTNVKGRMQKKQKLVGGETVFAGRDTIWTDYNFYCSASVAIVNMDRIKYDGRYFEVRGTDDANQMGHHQKVELLEIL